MKYQIKDKVIIITGASTGIGLSLTKQLLSKGALVVGCARRIDSLIQIKGNESNLEVIKCDLTKYSDIDKLVSFTIEKHGRIDMVINNAGIGLLSSINETTMDQIKNIFDTNFNGLVYLTKKSLPYFEKQKSGYYVNVASIAGLTPSIFNSIYTASKHAVVGFSDCIRKELRSKNIHVLVVNPAFVDTNFHKLNPKYLQHFGHHTKLVGFYSSDKYASKIVKSIENKDWDLTYPILAKFYSILCRAFPKLAELFS